MHDGVPDPDEIDAAHATPQEEDEEAGADVFTSDVPRGMPQTPTRYRTTSRAAFRASVPIAISVGSQFDCSP